MALIPSQTLILPIDTNGARLHEFVTDPFNDPRNKSYNAVRSHLHVSGKIISESDDTRVPTIDVADVFNGSPEFLNTGVTIADQRLGPGNWPVDQRIAVLGIDAVDISSGNTGLLTFASLDTPGLGIVASDVQGVDRVKIKDTGIYAVRARLSLPAYAGPDAFFKLTVFSFTQAQQSSPGSIISRSNFLNIFSLRRNTGDPAGVVDSLCYARLTYNADDLVNNDQILVAYEKPLQSTLFSISGMQITLTLLAGTS